MGCWKFIDSHRLFDMSLNELTKLFGVEGKSSEYNPMWNNLDFFDNLIEFDKFKSYSIQDSISLLNAMLSARKIYYQNYGVDITKTLSTPSLSLKIFRHLFLEQDLDSWIPILDISKDKLFREAYLGGATACYKFKYSRDTLGKDLKYVDVNSLYPFAMLNSMPQ